MYPPPLYSPFTYLLAFLPSEVSDRKGFEGFACLRLPSALPSWLRDPLLRQTGHMNNLPVIWTSPVTGNRYRVCPATRPGLVDLIPLGPGIPHTVNARRIRLT